MTSCTSRLHSSTFATQMESPSRPSLPQRAWLTESSCCYILILSTQVHMAHVLETPWLLKLQLLMLRAPPQTPVKWQGLLPTALVAWVMCATSPCASSSDLLRVCWNLGWGLILQAQTPKLVVGIFQHWDTVSNLGLKSQSFSSVSEEEVRQGLSSGPAPPSLVWLLPHALRPQSAPRWWRPREWMKGNVGLTSSPYSSSPALCSFH